jgi:glycerate kinase
MPSAAVAVTASSYGVGELIRAVLDLGIREIVVGVGGTASTDGGAGMLQALGAVLHDTGGEVLRPGGASLNDLATIDLRGLDQRLSNCRLVVATDVDNPLLGGNGAAAVFGPQKGADATAVRVLEHGLDRWSHLLAARLGRNQAGLPGAGAGGGIGFGLLTVGAARVSGAATLLDLLHFDDHAKTADLIVTGEGSMDATRLNGKAPTTLAKRAHALGVPVAAVVGRCTLSAAEQRQTGIDRVYVLLNIAESPEQSMRDAGRLLTKIGQQISASIDDATISDDPSR